MSLARLALSVPFALAFSLPLAGCSRNAEATDEKHTEAPKPAQPVATQPAVQQHAAPAPVAPAPATNEMANDGLPVVIPPPGSPAPTVAEWNAVHKEVTVRGSSSKGCETKMLREWLRVSCHATPGVTPTEVRTTTSSGQKAFVGTFGDKTSAVVQVVQGKDYTADFKWVSAAQATATSTLHVSWRSDQQRPTFYFSP